MLPEKALEDDRPNIGGNIDACWLYESGIELAPGGRP
jgi:hypothetical protein